MFFTELLSQSILMLTRSGAVVTVAGRDSLAGSEDGLGANAGFDGPVGLALDSHGIAFIADGMNHAVRAGAVVNSRER